MKFTHAIAAAAAGFAALAALQSADAQQIRRPGAAPAPAAAQPNWYVGAGLGRAEIPEGFNDGSIYDGRAFTTTGMKSQSSHSMAKGFVGFKLNRYVAIEGGYMSLGEFGAERLYTGPDGSNSVKWTSRGFNLGVVGILPLGESFSLQARVGAIRVQTKAEARSNGAIVATAASGKYALHYGVGAQYEINRNFAIRGEYELVKKAVNSNLIAWDTGNEFQYQAFSASGIYKF